MTVTNHLKNDRFLKRSLFKMSGSFLKRSFFSKTKQSFLKTIEKRNKKQSFNDCFQKRLTTLIATFKRQTLPENKFKVFCF